MIFFRVNRITLKTIIRQKSIKNHQTNTFYQNKNQGRWLYERVQKFLCSKISPNKRDS